MNKINLLKWEKYFNEIGIHQEYFRLYIDYALEITANGAPVIFEFNHLAKLLGRTSKYLASVINSPQHHYRTFHIPKRSGSVREIMAPYPALLECQQWINSCILSNVAVHNCAHGFRKKRSILTNVRPHLGRSHLLKMDIQDFFPSIVQERIISIFRGIGYSSNVSYYLSALCCVNGTLPQGAATSPTLSNIVAHRMDKRLFAFAKKNKLAYTRYADDLVLSGKHIDPSIIKFVAKVVDDEGFAINSTKTRLIRGNGKRIVTGISIVGKQPQLPRKFKRLLRQQIYYIKKYGLLSHLASIKNREVKYLQTLYGKISYWHWVEPYSKFAAENRKYIAQLIRNQE